MQEDASRRRMERIYIVGTADTKGEELSYTAREIAAAGGTPLIVDVGTRQPRCAVDIAAEAVARHHPDGVDAMLGPDDRGTAGMRELPIGLPKLMVSTVAAGDVGAYVGVSDITMMYSVTDIAGLNRISRVVLANAAHAVVGMVRVARRSRRRTVDRADHVRRHHTLRDPSRRPAQGHLRLHRLPCHRHRRPCHGEARQKTALIDQTRRFKGIRF